MVVIAAVDRSDRAQRVAKEASSLAQAFDEPLHLVHVISRSEYVNIETTSVEESGRPVEMEEIRAFATEQADKVSGELDIEYELVGHVGDPASEIVNYAAEQDAHYIVVGGRQRSPTGKAVFGSVTQSILLNADRPVVSVIE